MDSPMARAVLGKRLDDTIEVNTPGGTREYTICLLYTSDAADERSSVDLGGRRIIKKKQQCKRQRT